MIHRFYVNNFRCLENFELPLEGKPSSLLIGRNGAGKSTVGLALEVLQSIGRGTNRVGQLLKPADFARGRSDVPIRIELALTLDRSIFQYTLAVELPDGFKELRVLEERLTVDSKDLYSRERAQVALARTSADKEARFLVDWHLVALPIIQEQSDTDPLFIFKNWLARMLILAPTPSLIKGDSEGDTLLPKRDVTNFGEWFSGLLAHAPAAYSRIAGYLADVIPDLDDIRNPVTSGDFRRISVQFKHDKASLSLPFDALSDGEKCFFISAVVLAANRAYGPILCFWDEPDNYLSLTEVGHFVMSLRRSFETGGQLIVTSHNPEAIPQFSDENTFLLHRPNHLEPVRDHPISEVQVHGDLVNALIRGDVGV